MRDHNDRRPPEKALHKEQGLRIRKRRLEIRMTAATLADLVGVEQSTVTRYEKGSRCPNLQRMRNLANALGKPPAYFTDGVDSEPNREGLPRGELFRLVEDEYEMTELQKARVRRVLNKFPHEPRSKAYLDALVYMAQDPNLPDAVVHGQSVAAQVEEEVARSTTRKAPPADRPKPLKRR